MELSADEVAVLEKIIHGMDIEKKRGSLTLNC